MTAATDRPDHLIPNDRPRAEELCDAIVAHHCLAILRLLAGPLNGRGNDHLLLDVLRTIGLTTSHRELQKRLDTLERIGALRLERRDGLLVTILRAYGAELAEGVERHEGVAPPPIDYPL